MSLLYYLSTLLTSLFNGLLIVLVFHLIKAKKVKHETFKNARSEILTREFRM